MYLSKIKPPGRSRPSCSPPWTRPRCRLPCRHLRSEPACYSQSFLVQTFIFPFSFYSNILESFSPRVTPAIFDLSLCVWYSRSNLYLVFTKYNWSLIIVFQLYFKIISRILSHVEISALNLRGTVDHFLLQTFTFQLIKLREGNLVLTLPNVRFSRNFHQIIFNQKLSKNSWLGHKWQENGIMVTFWRNFDLFFPLTAAISMLQTGIFGLLLVGNT